jgi:hypothetical protein
MAGWENRELCPDGACVGVIGGNGKCNVCGTPAPNWNPDKRAAASGDAGDDSVESDDLPERAPPATSADPETGDPDWDNRQLCPDGSCTGLIGPGGACTVCRRTPAEIAAESAT